MTRFFVSATLFTIVFNLAVLWVLGSVVTSGVKGLSNDCGKRYPVEAVLAGNWFCPEDNDNE